MKETTLNQQMFSDVPPAPKKTDPLFGPITTERLRSLQEVPEHDIKRALSFVRSYVLLKYRQDPDAADDIAQKTIIKLIKRIREGKHDATLRITPYFQVVVDREIIDARNNATRREIPISQLPSAPPDPRSETGRPEIASVVCEFLSYISQKLTEEEFKIIRLEFSGCKLREIAETLNTPYTTLCYKRKQAIGKIRADPDWYEAWLRDRAR